MVEPIENFSLAMSALCIQQSRRNLPQAEGFNKTIDWY